MEKNLTDEEIVKAYEHCKVKDGRCTDCILVDEDKICISSEDVLDLIQRQKDIIQKQCDFVEKLEADYGKLVAENAELKEERENMEREILALHKDLYNSKQKMMVYHLNEIESAIKETAKEMIEEIDSVKEIFPNDISGYDKAQGWCMCIDKLKEIAKERYSVEVE